MATMSPEHLMIWICLQLGNIQCHMSTLVSLLKDPELLGLLCNKLGDLNITKCGENECQMILVKFEGNV